MNRPRGKAVERMATYTWAFWANQNAHVHPIDTTRRQGKGKPCTMSSPGTETPSACSTLAFSLGK